MSDLKKLAQFSGGSVVVRSWANPDGTRETEYEIKPSKKGAVTGATAGAALGSVVPVIGTTVGAVVGGALGFIFGPAD